MGKQDHASSVSSPSLSSMRMVTDSPRSVVVTKDHSYYNDATFSGPSSPRSRLTTLPTGVTLPCLVSLSPSSPRRLFDTYWQKVGNCDREEKGEGDSSIIVDVSKQRLSESSDCSVSTLSESSPVMTAVPLPLLPASSTAAKQYQRRQIFSPTNGKDKESVLAETLAADLKAMGVDIPTYYRPLPSSSSLLGSKASPISHSVSDSVILVDIQKQKRRQQQQQLNAAAQQQPLSSCLRKSRYSAGRSKSCSVDDGIDRTMYCRHSSTTSWLSESSSSSSSSSSTTSVSFNNEVTVVRYEIPTDSYCEGGWTTYFSH